MTPAEREILRCVRAGEVADFFQGRPTGRRRRVDAAFLRDLWLELSPERKIHPTGIHLRGVRIVGGLDLRNVAFSASGRATLCPLAAEDCIFEGLITVAGASIQRFELVRCQLKGGPDDHSGEVLGLAGGAVDIAGECLLTEIECRLPIDLMLAKIGKGIAVSDCRGLGEVRLSGATIGGPAVFYGCRFSAKGPARSCISAISTRVTDKFLIERCMSTKDVCLNWMSTGQLAIYRCRLGSVGLLAVKTLSQLTVEATRVAGQVSIYNAKVGDVLHIVELFVRPVRPDQVGLSIVASQIEGTIRIDRSRIGGGIDMQSTRADQILLTAAKIIGDENAGIDLSSVATGNLKLMQLCLDGWVILASGRVRGTLLIYNSKIGRLIRSAAAAKTPPSAQAISGGSRPNEPAARPVARSMDLTNTKVDGDLLVQGCAIGGTMFSANLEIGNSLLIEQSWIAGIEGHLSVELYRLVCGNLLSFYDSIIDSGLGVPMGRCAEMQVVGCSITCPGHSRWRGKAIWAAELGITRRLHFAGSEPYGAGAATNPNRIAGRIDFRNSAIGQDVQISSMICAPPPDLAKGASAGALDFGGATVGRSFLLADRGFDQRELGDAYDVPAEIEGCVNLDDAVVGGSLLIHRTVLKARGNVARPNSVFASEERVSKRKRGVALSLRDATVSGELELGRPKIAGLVDLRGATISLIADGGGRRWSGAGLAPGHLLLDGLTYQRLDDIDDSMAGSAPSRAADNVSVAVERRLDWLGLQFVDRRADSDSFVPQPYEQLARVFAEDGNERARRRVIVAKRDLQRRCGRLGSFERGIGWLLKQTSDYGYSPSRAALALTLFIAVGALAATWLDTYHALVPAEAGRPPVDHLSPLVYAIDVALPIVDLQQADKFMIDAGRLPGFWSNGDLVGLLRALYELAGFILVSITVLTFTGTLREKE
ncbi:MAG TPA: hypothetical protein VK614_14735 [Allosphingosinicella sp.]|nr:hypothetical protein [Allosphingosinicella sp.]